MDKNLFATLSDETGYSSTNKSKILNPYVNFHKAENVQTLNDVLIAESIQMRGIEFHFIPREFVDIDYVFGEDTQSKFTKSWKFAAYLENFDSYGGQNSFYSKFDLQSNDEVTLVINPWLFKNQCDNQEPKIGDLVYFPMDNSLFELNWIEPYTPFYQNGANFQRRLIAQKFIYSNEELAPVLQTPSHIDIPEFSELELEPVIALDGIQDTSKEQHIYNKAFEKEAQEYVREHTVINGIGDQSPFSDFP